MKHEKKGINVGIDVGKFQLDIFIWERDRHFTVENNEQGIPCVNLEDKPGCQCGIAFHNNTKWVNLLFLLFILLSWRIRND